MKLYPCKICGRRMVLRNSDESWKTKCVICWKESQDMEYSGADLYILRLEQELADEDAGFVGQNIKALIKLCHPDRHSNSEEANRVKSWLLDKYQNRMEVIASW